MNVIVCVDDKDGVSFNKRRQSRDRILYEKIIRLLDSALLYISPYSESLFENYENKKISEEYLQLALKGEYCFAERNTLRGLEEKIEKLILVKWNRIYPADRFLELRKDVFQCVRAFEFEGSSHDKITVEVYEKIRSY